MFRVLYVPITNCHKSVQCQLIEAKGCIYVSINLAIPGFENGLSPVWCQTIT